MTSTATASNARSAPRTGRSRRQRRMQSGAALVAQGHPTLWATGGALALALCMILGLLLLVLRFGILTFWPQPVVQLNCHDGTTYLGEVTDHERFRVNPEVLAELAPQVQQAIESDQGLAARRQVRTGNFDVGGAHFEWVEDYRVADEARPEWALVLERLEWGRFYGFPQSFLVDGQPVVETPDGAWSKFQELHAPSRQRWRERRNLERSELGRVNARIESARLKVRQAELRYGAQSHQYREAVRNAEEVRRGAESEAEKISAEIAKLNAENERYQLLMRTASGTEKAILLADVVRAYPANQLGFLGRLGVYLSRWREFLLDDPREANSEGGVLPAIIGTVVMTLGMAVMVVPFGVLAALYLREYAKAGPMISAVRIAVNNLAGVPSIVFGVFGLGFFCYLVGARIDELLFASKLPNPTYGKGGLIWASLTLALMTLPVVIVATEEALAAVPRSMREGSYACGASKWQTIWRIVLPRALPGIMTGAILAMARGAGEVAPLMLVGAVKLAPKLPIDGNWPFIHLERSFMHLGFHIYDLGFQSQNSEAAKPMVYTTTLLLIVVIASLNLAAIWLRARLRRRFVAAQF